MKEKGIGSIRMVSLTCNHCGANLDTDIDNLQAFCPFCGAHLFITVSRVMDILKEKGDVREKGLTYKKDMTVVQQPKKSKRFGIGVLIRFAAILILLAAAGALLYFSKTM